MSIDLPNDVLVADTIINLPELPYSYVAIIITILTFIVLGVSRVAYLSAFKTKSFQTFDELNRTLTSINSTIKGLDASIATFNTDTRLYFMTSRTLGSASALKLSVLGQKVSDEIDALKIASELESNMDEDVSDFSPYDIQKFSFEYVHSNYDPDELILDRLKQCAYDNGIDLRELFDVIALELRDLLINQPDEENVDE